MLSIFDTHTKTHPFPPLIQHIVTKDATNVSCRCGTGRVLHGLGWALSRTPTGLSHWLVNPGGGTQGSWSLGNLPVAGSRRSEHPHLQPRPLLGPQKGVELEWNLLFWLQLKGLFLFRYYSFTSDIPLGSLKYTLIFKSLTRQCFESADLWNQKLSYSLF